MIDKQKERDFHESVIEDYNRSLEIEDLSIVRITERVDPSSFKIGMRTQIPEQVFESLYQSWGRDVALGEVTFLMNQLLENKEINRTKLNQDTDLVNHLDFNKNIIIISTKFYVEIFTKLSDKITYGERHPLLYGIYPIISIPEKILGNKIVILEKDALFIEKEIFTDEITNKKEKINVKTKSSGFNVEVLVYSVVNIRDIDMDKIKILEVEENGK
jgi:hypothetical protein